MLEKCFLLLFWYRVFGILIRKKRIRIRKPTLCSILYYTIQFELENLAAGDPEGLQAGESGPALHPSLHHLHLQDLQLLPTEDLIASFQYE